MSGAEDKVRVFMELQVARIISEREGDEALYGYSAIKIYPDGTWKRIDPKDITPQSDE